MTRVYYQKPENWIMLGIECVHFCFSRTMTAKESSVSVYNCLDRKPVEAFSHDRYYAFCFLDCKLSEVTYKKSRPRFHSWFYSWHYASCMRHNEDQRCLSSSRYVDQFKGRLYNHMYQLLSDAFDTMDCLLATEKPPPLAMKIEEATLTKYCPSMPVLPAYLLAIYYIAYQLVCMPDVMPA